MDVEKPLPVAREMAAEDLAGVVSLHRLCFADYFLTGLGPGVLELFYRAAVEDPRSVAAVLEAPGKDIVGLCVGTLNPAFHGRLMRENLSAFALGIVRGLFTSSVVRRGIRQRVGFISKIFRPSMDDTLDRAGVPPAELPQARLLDVAVHPDWRGANAERLVEYFTARMFNVGAGRVGAAVMADNMASLILYKRLGWEFQRSSPSRVDVWVDRQS
jgi:ribosomal protein S18 acetylase RimI-like enzyme